ncbi:hypothetical protein CLV62_1263 [Dysgonomonas alginatilytica]|uniref:Uncharacterized protein n=1 Tax=Dysgonomonas alginatilytica TaxID=1605892 RepID=A0A2V3PLY3_9BACT|nr:hypothetical protein [Dysgonomonas alginatilytica]PXV61069.1 hypothetical protein CLV62_1263 [Dysgonomonas alginatilytica]
MTPSEKYVSELCEKSFLPFWSYLSPLGKNNKELCDVLLICENDIVIISIKDIKVSDHPDPSVQYNRWHSKAIDGSLSQIYGAERFIESVEEITLNNRITKIKLPEKKDRVIFRVAVAFGSKKDFPLNTGDFGNGYVHVFDEDSTFTVINELDTFPDFINYLKAKEQFTKGKIVKVPKEVDFLALYIKTSLEFDYTPDTIIIDEGLWNEYTKSDEYIKWKKDIKPSYIWDEIITTLYKLHIEGKANSEKHSELEIATRAINLESRMNRIELGIVLEDMLKRNIRARMLKEQPHTNHTYVLLRADKKNWESKESELQLRCFIAKKDNPNVTKIIGLTFGIDENGNDMFDLAYFYLPELNEEAKRRIEIVQQELGYFTNPQISRSKNMR